MKTEDTDGYNAVQVGYEVSHKKKPTITKPELNHLTKAGAPAMKKLVEFKVQADSKIYTYCCEQKSLTSPPALLMMIQQSASTQQESCTRLKSGKRFAVCISWQSSASQN